ncbi:MAG: FGGY-family carbohydrate kinase, partial [Candidatus Promineifilaceae bacterium]
VMTLLGIDVGTTGFKIAQFSLEGERLASVYQEHNIESPAPGQAQLDASAVWRSIKQAIRSITAVSGSDIQAIAVSSLGEAVVPVSADGRILGPSILNFDERGAEFLPALASKLPDERLYAANGNTLGNHYSLTKLLWIKAHQPDLYETTHKFLHWSGFVSFMLGGEAAVDYSLANRTLLFDLQAKDWSDDLLRTAGLDGEKLPPTVPSGTVIGRVSQQISRELGLPRSALIVAGAHDQGANAVGCGVINPGSAVYGMGTFHCITPVFASRPPAELMIARGLNTEHHAAPDRYVCFLYNQGGSLVHWFRDTFAADEHARALRDGASIYPRLFAELPRGPGSVMVLPHFTVTGPPGYIADSAGLIAGLRLDTRRGDILKGIIEGAAFYLKELVDSLPGTGIEIGDFRAAGGGSQSDAWVQTCADIFNRPVTRPVITEAGALGAAIIAGVGAGLFNSYETAVRGLVTFDRTFEPDAALHEQYQARYEQYKQLWPLMADYLRGLHYSALSKK